MIVEHKIKAKLSFEQRNKITPDKPTSKHFQTAQMFGWKYEGDGFWSRDQILGWYENGSFKKYG